MWGTGCFSPSINPRCAATLRRQAAWAAKYPPVDVLIAGNADERGTPSFDLALAEGTRLKLRRRRSGRFRMGRIVRWRGAMMRLRIGRTGMR